MSWPGEALIRPAAASSSACRVSPLLSAVTPTHYPCTLATWFLFLRYTGSVTDGFPDSGRQECPRRGRRETPGRADQPAERRRWRECRDPLQLRVDAYRRRTDPCSG